MTLPMRDDDDLVQGILLFITEHGGRLPNASEFDVWQRAPRNPPHRPVDLGPIERLYADGRWTDAITRAVDLFRRGDTPPS